jgi:hypothetical protein
MQGRSEQWQLRGAAAYDRRKGARVRVGQRAPGLEAQLQLRHADGFAGRPQHAQRFGRQLTQPAEVSGTRKGADIDEFQPRWTPM